MILRTTSLLGVHLVAIKKGKPVTSDIYQFNLDKKTIRSSYGRSEKVDYFVAICVPDYLKPQYERLGIPYTRDIKRFLAEQRLKQREVARLKKYNSKKKKAA